LNGAMTSPPTSLRFQLLIVLLDTEAYYQLAQKWNVDWRDFLWRVRLLDEASAASLLLWLGTDLAARGTCDRPNAREVVQALGARPPGSHLVLEYACGHRETGQVAQVMNPPHLCRVTVPCPTCQLREHGAGAVQTFQHADPRDALALLDTRSRVLEELRELEQRYPEERMLHAIMDSYFFSLSDVEWWLDREFDNVPNLVNNAVHDAIRAVATRAEAEALMLHESPVVRDGALRRLAILLAG